MSCVWTCIRCIRCATTSTKGGVVARPRDDRNLSPATNSERGPTFRIKPEREGWYSWINH
jgi:hypothetical protein